MGLLGGGGSILTVPIFVYIFEQPAHLATGYSLFVVATGAFVGSLLNIRLKTVDSKTGFFFAVPSILGVWISRKWILPQLPDIILGQPQVTKDQLILCVFACLMLAAAKIMIAPQRKDTKQKNNANLLHAACIGFVIGILVGFVGAGGGFLIVPALIWLKNLDMKIAVGTSLFVILINTTAGFLTDLLSDVRFDLTLLFSFASVVGVGIFLGHALKNKLGNATLKKAFGYFVLVFAIVILITELKAS